MFYNKAVSHLSTPGQGLQNPEIYLYHWNASFQPMTNVVVDKAELGVSSPLHNSELLLHLAI